jgi:hypothetical protein
MADRNRPQAQGSTMKLQLAPDDPLVKQALSGIFKSTCGRLFFKIDELTGEHRKISVAKQLASLNITEHNRRSLVRSYVFTELPYASERMKQKAEALANKKPQVGRQEAKEVDGYDFAKDEPIAEESEEEAQCVKAKRNCHYHLVQQNNGYWGVYDGRDGGQVLFTEKEQAEEYLQDLLHHREGKMFYGNRN